MGSEVKFTKAQLEMLRQLSDTHHGRPRVKIRIGGHVRKITSFNRTAEVLERRGLLEFRNGRSLSGWFITDAGTAALSAATGATP